MPNAPTSWSRQDDGDWDGSSVEVRTGDSGYSAVVALRGEHDIATRFALHDTLAPLYGRVLVDLSDCTFIDSTVIGVLIDKTKQLVRDGGSLELQIPSGPSPVRYALTLMGIGHVIPVHDGRHAPNLNHQASGMDVRHG